MLVILFFPLFLLNQELFSLLALPRNVHALNRQMVGWAWRDLKGHSHASASFCSTDARLYIDIQLIFADCSQILILSVVQYLFFFLFYNFPFLSFSVVGLSGMHACSDVSESATPWTIACQAPLSMEFSRKEYWSGLPFSPPGDRPTLGIEHTSPALAGSFLTTEPPGKPRFKEGYRSCKSTRLASHLIAKYSSSFLLHILISM